MHKFLCAGAAVAAVGSMIAFGAAAQPAAGPRPAEPLSVITDGAHVDKASVGGGDCTKAGVLQSDKGALNTSHYMIECSNKLVAKAPFGPEVHPVGQDTIYYIFKGDATLAYGGQITGKELTGDTKTMHLSAGDVAVLPGGMPYWYKNVSSDVYYMVIRRQE